MLADTQHDILKYNVAVVVNGTSISFNEVQGARERTLETQPSHDRYLVFDFPRLS